jgi:polysaccharide export outer membrane protein
MFRPAILFCAMVLVWSPLSAQSVPTAAARQDPPAASPGSEAATTKGVTPPPGYVIGPEDQLQIVFWRDKDMSADVTVRPDGKISLPLLNEVQAAGYTPDQLRASLMQAASKYVEDPNATVIVKEIHSRNAFITGNVTKPGTYPLSANMTVLQLIAVAGGLQEYADKGHIVIIRTANGRQEYHKFNYDDVVKQKSPTENIVLQPGDTVIVP